MYYGPSGPSPSHRPSQVCGVGPAEFSFEALAGVGAPVLGVVVNDVIRPAHSKSYQYYRYTAERTNRWNNYELNGNGNGHAHSNGNGNGHSKHLANPVVDVEEVGPLAAGDEQRLPTDTAEGAGGTVDAAGDEPGGSLEGFVAAGAVLQILSPAAFTNNTGGAISNSGTIIDCIGTIMALARTRKTVLEKR